MSLKLVQYHNNGSEKSLFSEKHILIVLDSNIKNNFPFEGFLQNKLKRGQSEFKDLLKKTLSLDLANGSLVSFVVLDKKISLFQKHSLLKQAVKPLLAESPSAVTICVFGDDDAKQMNACAAYYVLTVNAAELPTHKSKPETATLKAVTIYGYKAGHNYENVNARVIGNTLCRQLTMLPPNALTPSIYREKIAEMAKQYDWESEVFDMTALKKIGAGAFVAVGQGSDPQDAAIVHLTYTPKNIKKNIALVGKGICFDTGGHNLKPAKYMQGMHEDMNGSAVALGVLTAATEMQLPIKIDCWLAIAQNHIGPLAYKQNDVVTALNGMTIEIVHTDAEGRMVLADTLTLASRQKPDVILDYATLTGSMEVAVTDRMSGVVGNRPALLCKAVGAGVAAGERIVAFPYEEDMDSDLDSDIADIKQCSLEGGGDHMHAARFLGKFIENDVAWLHADLSSTNRKGGLGAVQSTVNGFGVGFGLEMLKQLLDN